MDELGGNLEIRSISKETEMQAKKLIIKGLNEHFNSYDESKNPDLDNIIKNYIEQGEVFLVGLYNDEIICTGGLIEEDNKTGRIVRMSVKKDFRRQGIATKLLEKLELKAKKRGYKKIVLETTKDWLKAISFYKKCGYIEYTRDKRNVHFQKLLKATHSFD